MENLVIVESPTKANTLSKFLGNKYQIEASMGHVRDLPKSNLSIDVDNNFAPHYIIPKDKVKRVHSLIKTLQSAKTLWLATDPDREGEAIAWHIEQLLKHPEELSYKKEKPTKGKKAKKVDDINQQTFTNRGTPQIIKRVVFHEITEEAIKEAFLHPRDLDQKLVDAQQARRILDRIVGYKLSPVLWKKVKSGLSAGRVQSVALRLVVEREAEVKKFNPVEYWSIDAELRAMGSEASIKGENRVFIASLSGLNNKKLEIKNKEEADKHLGNLKPALYKILKITQKQTKRNPAPPFTTSTMQQAGANKLGMSAKKTMTLAQQLYERGLITYMRTDSVNLSTQALSSSRTFIEKNYGKPYLPLSSRVFKTKSKLAQEAHEAIRPTNVQVTPDKLQAEGIGREHQRLYDLIWKRLVASQMSEAILDNTLVDVEASHQDKNYQLKANGSVIKFDGWLRLYSVQTKPVETTEDSGDENEKDDEEKILPQFIEGEELSLLELLPLQHFTEPPPRFNEASLIKQLEELGIGRPSTYASIMSTILERFYVEKVEKKLIPTELGIAVSTFLVKYFPDIVDFTFTASMEDELDEIATGKLKWQETLAKFYTPFEKKVEETSETAERMNVEPELSDRKCPDCGSNLVVRFGRLGKFLGCTRFPDCKHTENMEGPITTPCPKCGGEIVERRTKKGRTFYGCKNYPNCDYASWDKPGEKKNDKKTEDKNPN